MATRTAGGRVGRTIYMDEQSWAALSSLQIPGVRRRSDSARLEALVLQWPQLVSQLESQREEVTRLRAQLKRVQDLGFQVEMAQRQIESALQSVIERIQPVRELVYDALTARERSGQA